MRTGVVYSEESFEMNSTILKTTVVTVTPSPGDSSALSGSIMTAIAIAVVAVASLMLLMAVVVVVVVAILRKKSKTEQYEVYIKKIISYNMLGIFYPRPFFVYIYI